MTAAEDGNTCGVVATRTADAESSSDWFTGSVDDFRYLCPMGGCVTQAEMAARPQCAWAVVPAHAVIVNPNLVGNDVVEDIQGAWQLPSLPTPKLKRGGVRVFH